MLIAAALAVTPDVFREAFRGVTPAKGRGPTDDEAKKNKAALMKVLKPHGVTNDRLDEVSNFYRYRPQNGELWRVAAAKAHAVVEGGKITQIVVDEPGYGYSSPPTATVSGLKDISLKVAIRFAKDLKNGAVEAIELAFGEIVEILAGEQREPPVGERKPAAHAARLAGFACCGSSQDRGRCRPSISLGPQSDPLLRFAATTIAILVTAIASCAADDKTDFDQHVAPILAERCLGCHSGTRPKGGLDLTSAMAARKGTKKGPALVVGNPDESPLWIRVETGEMPPKSPLSAPEKAILKSWIAKGAFWGTDPIDPLRTSSKRRAGYDWWSLHLPPGWGAGLPSHERSPWPSNPIDRFVLAGNSEPPA